MVHRLGVVVSVLLWISIAGLAQCRFDPDATVGHTSAVCGNGTVEKGEDCEETPSKGVTCKSIGFLGGTLACADDCTYDTSRCVATTTCGNGVLDFGEGCDDGNHDNTDACPDDGPNGGICQLATCGDGFVWAGQETCDDGNQDNTDACPDDGAHGGTCQPATCGDGLVWVGHEGCDDGNHGSGDGCSGSCALESCGNGVVDNGEGCDDGNHDNTDACPDDGANGGTCQPATCGDGFVWAGQETCDDGNRDNTDNCPDDGANGGTCQPAICGDGFVWSGHEDCDDGNIFPGDGCSSSCATEGGTCVASGFISCDGSVSGTVHSSDPNQVDTYSCTPADESNGDVIYSFATDTDQSVTIDLTVDMMDDLDLFLLRGVCDPDNCIGRSGNAVGQNESITFAAEHGVTYFIVVEAYSTTSMTGDFTLSVSCQ
ncbi:MAG: DUF4215 domain-containing protein [Deltaproteobacteria bacterium]|nr:DUF4215 domain-containing protein [Deltaproteobacteria bacterium]